MSKESDLVARIEGVDVQSVAPDEDATSFFQSRQTALGQSIDEDEVTSLGEVFYTALGSKLSGIDLIDEFESSVKLHLVGLATESGGYYELTDEMLSGVNKWNKTENEPTALGTAYSVLLAYLLDIPYPNPPKETAEWWEELVDDSGLFINEEWSDTKLRYRYPSEYLGGAFLTHTAAKVLSDNEGTDALDTSSIATFIEDKLFSTAQLAAEYYAIRLLEIAEKTGGIDTDSLSNLFGQHKDEVGAGYSDYLLSEKKDEQSGSKSRTGRDSVHPHICATVQALILSGRYGIKTEQEISNEFATLLSSDKLEREEGGYGFPIHIREYESGYGDVATSRTTYYALLGKELF